MHAYDICICLYIHVDILFDKLPCMRKISFKAHAECSTYILSNVQRITDSVELLLQSRNGSKYQL